MISQTLSPSLYLFFPGLDVPLKGLIEFLLVPPLEQWLRPLRESIELVKGEHEWSAQSLGQDEGE